MKGRCRADERQRIRHLLFVSVECVCDQSAPQSYSNNPRSEMRGTMQIATVRFTDLDSGDEASAMVRVMEKTIGLALSLKRNGDIEVFFGTQELDELIEALQKARAIARRAD